jgi:hypothetical protein
MYNFVLVVDTTYATTAAITLPSRTPDIDYMPTTQYVEGGGVVAEADVFDNTTTTFQITRQVVRNNVLMLRYVAVGELVRA